MLFVVVAYVVEPTRDLGNSLDIFLESHLVSTQHSSTVTHECAGNRCDPTEAKNESPIISHICGCLLILFIPNQGTRGDGSCSQYQEYASSTQNSP